MTSLNEIDPLSDKPDVGSEVVLPIVQSATRTTLFPDQTIVSGVAEFVELILVRQEWVVVRQKGKVEATASDHFDFKITNTEGRAQLYDIGHVRLQSAVAKDMAIAIFQHMVKTESMDKAQIIRLIDAAIAE
jgi:hypothetical protein